jgi:hypothetical protein
MIRNLINVLASKYEQALFRFGVLINCGFCPGGCMDGLQGPTGRVYRSSRRSLTMQCTRCQLQWTVTVHRIADVAARKAARAEASPEERFIAEALAAWASGVEEQRGRRSRAAGGAESGSSRAEAGTSEACGDAPEEGPGRNALGAERHGC